MAPRSTLAALAEELAHALEPLSMAFEDEVGFVSFMQLLGWDAFGVIQPVADLAGLAEGVQELIATKGLDPDDVPELVGRLDRFFTAVRAVSTVSAAALPGTIDVNEFRVDFPRQLIDFLVVEHLRYRRPKIGRVLELLGIVGERDIAASASRPRYIRREVDWRALMRALRDPAAQFRDAYRFGESAFEGVKVLDVAYRLAQGFGLQPRPGLLSAAERAFLRQGATSGTLAPVHNSAIRWVVAENPVVEPPIVAGVGLAITPETPTSAPGFAILPFVRGIESGSFMLTSDVTIDLKGAFSMVGGVALRIRPNLPPALDVGFVEGAATGASEVSIAIELPNSGGMRRVLIGDPDASRLEVGKLALRGGARVQTGTTPSAFVEIEARDGSIVIAPGAGDADGFLASILPGKWEVGFGATIGFDDANGLYFTGSAGLEIQLAVHQALGPIEVRSAQIAIRPRDDAGGVAIPIELTSSLVATFGPLECMIDNVGVRADLAFPDGGGRLGPADFALGFRPPSGVGLLVRSQSVRGGGFLSLDPTKGEYFGAVELSLFDLIAIQGVGYITTRLPDGSRGFSLIILLTADFGLGIQLGLGFTLFAVGGLLALNRAMRIDVLAQAIHSGAVESLLFPSDVVANAPRIISDLRSLFPPRPGGFLIGPMVKLGWGTPILLRLSLGVLIEVPGNVGIVGVLSVTLPNEETPLLVVQARFVGALELDRARIWFFATLFESRVLFVPIDGEMGVLAAVGDDKNLVVAVGGFHPRFPAPPLPFPTPNRVVLSLLNTSVCRIQGMGYFAVTTNTAQIGARVELYYGFSFAKLEGELGFDALFRFSPFEFVAEMAGSVSFKVFGVGLFSIRLELTLEGPNPYHARGRGKVSLLFVSFSANFSVTWSVSLPILGPLLEVMKLLARELGKAESWSVVLPPWNKLLVSLRPHDPLTGGLLLHPAGTLRVAQRSVPLDLELAKVGNTTPADGRRFALRVRGGALVKRADAEEKFAPAQFREMTDAERLSASAFVPEHAGLELEAPEHDARTSRAVQRVVRYEEIIIDSNFRRAASTFGTRGGLLFTHLLANGAVARSTLSQANRRARTPFADRVEVAEGGFVVAFARDNSAAGSASTFASADAARDFVAREVARDPALAQELHVIPAFEVNDAA